MKNIIYSYGGGEALYQVLNGVKMIFEHGATKSLLHLMTFVGLAWAAFQGASQNSWTPKLSWLTKYVLITSLFITPTATLYIRDSVYGTMKNVDGLPIGLVLPASVFSGIGFGITEVFDQAFSTVDNNIPYTKYGQSFGAALISQARNFKIQDSGFRENMESFIDNCMLYDVMIGRKYSGSDMRNSKEIWALAMKNASNIRMMNYRDPDKTVKRKLVSCKDGAGLLNSYWDIDINRLGAKFGDTIFGKYGRNMVQAGANQEFLGKTFKTNVDVVGAMYGNHGKATENLKQIMMINALADIPMSYGGVRAKQQQQESWLISGELAREILPTLHAVFSALIYASFTLIIGMLVLPNGFKTLANYLGLLIWIETWPPLFAVLNLLTNVSSKTYGGDFNAITMNNISQIINHNNNISVVASGMMMVLPYLSYNILKGGAGQFVHLASQVMGSSQSAAMAASNEVTSGNRSLDNVSMLNSQWSNNSGFKTDLNSSFRSGHREHQLASGMIVKESPNGKIITQSGPGITETVGSKSMHMSTNNSVQTHQSLNDEQSQLASIQDEYSDSKQTMQRQAMELVNRLASGEASGEHYSYNHATATGKTLNAAISKSKELHDSHAYNNSQATETLITGGANVKVGASGEIGAGGGSIIPVGGKVSAGVDVEAGAKISGRADSMNIQSLTEDKGAGTSANVTKQTEDIARAAKDIQFSKTQTEEKALADSLIGSYEEMKQLRKSISVSEQKIQRYQTSSDSSQSTSLTVGEDTYPKLVEYIAGQRDETGFKIGAVEAAKIAEKGGERFNKHKQAFYKDSQAYQQVQSPKFDYEKLNKDHMPQNIDLKKDYTEVSEVGNAVMEASKTVVPDAKEMVERQHKTASNKIKSAEQKILQSGELLQKNVDIQEDDRHWYSPGRDKITGKKFTE